MQKLTLLEVYKKNWKFVIVLRKKKKLRVVSSKPLWLD